jgi:hypothetical protein
MKHCNLTCSLLKRIQISDSSMRFKTYLNNPLFLLTRPGILSNKYRIVLKFTNKKIVFEFIIGFLSLREEVNIKEGNPLVSPLVYLTFYLFKRRH